MDGLEGVAFAGEGLLWAYDNGDWCVGIKNYKSQNSIEALDRLELHRETDEIFVHVEGSCCLLFLDEAGFRGSLMRSGSLYTVPRGTWHATVTRPGAKMVIAERSGTDLSNSEIRMLEGEEAAAAVAAVRAAGF